MFHKLHLISFGFVLAIASNAPAQNLLQLYYDERIPYAEMNENGIVRGLTATPTAAAFEATDIPFIWKKMPFKRQLATIKANRKKACGIGWFKNPEREEFARFSAPIYQDKPTIVISRKGSEFLSHHSTVASLLSDTRIKLLLKDGFSYGSYLDAMIEQHQPDKLMVVGSSNLEMLKVLLSGRADYFFAAEEEAEEIIKSGGYTMSQFELQRFNGMPAGNNRYLACSQQVSPEMIERFNQSLK
jgi:polar amino acid transport system substrate-binding protein